MNKLLTHKGGCHCGAVQFEVQAPAQVTAYHCNCSLCIKLGFEHLIVPQHQFKLLSATDNMTTYTFNTGVAQHTFCKHCGVKSFYTPRSNPDGISVNVRCLEKGTIEKISYANFDGENWEANADKLKDLA